VLETEDMKTTISIRQVQTMYRNLANAHVAADGAAAGRMFDARARLVNPDGSVIRGRGAIVRSLKALWRRTPVRAVAFKILEIGRVWDSTSYDIARYSLRLASRECELVEHGTHLVIWRKGKDGSWRIFLDMAIIGSLKKLWHAGSSSKKATKSAKLI